MAYKKETVCKNGLFTDYSDILRLHRHHDRALRADHQRGAAALAEHAVDHLDIRIQTLHRHLGLNGAGKTAAMHALSALALQEAAAELNAHRHLLLIGAGIDVLQELPAAVAGALNRVKEGIKIAGLDGGNLLEHAGVVVNEGGATAADVLALVELIKARVYDLFGVMLECEFRYVGE